FLEEYLLCGFSIKSLEKTTPHGYAAIRSRLDKVIDNYKQLKKNDLCKKAILEQLSKGKISVDQAKDQLENI
ncbi:MAG: DUF2089 family protein, partial [Anaerohalosphaera sp.]|nr:DUF2089 family protein [Anaerohalosphaera sp.]